MFLALTCALVAAQSPAVKHLSEGPQIGAPAGVALAPMPDWNGDGVTDYVVGIPDYAITTSGFGLIMEEAGRVEVRSGLDGSLLLGVNEFAVLPGDPVRMGQSVAGGFVANTTDPTLYPMAGAPGAGEVRLFTNSASGGTVVASASNSLLFNDESFGAVIANIGDITGDGRPELAVGSPLGDRIITIPGSPITVDDVGRVRVFEGGTYAPIGTWTLSTGSGMRFGSSIMAIADINGDGVSEMAVGAPGEGAGNVYIIDPTVSGSPGILAQLSGTNDGDEFGASLANLGDLDGGGRDELLIGAPGRSVGLSFTVRTGSVEVFDGESFTQLWTKNGSLFGYVGETVAAADLDGDGFKSALLIDGATSFDQPDVVRAYDGLTGVEQFAFDAWPSGTGAALAAGLDAENDGGEEFLVGLPELNDAAGGQLCYGLFLGTGGGPGTGSVWTVDDNGPADFRSLATASLVVSPNDTVLVRSGSYTQATITKPLTVMGDANPQAGPVVIDGIDVDGASRVTLTGVTLSHLALRDVPGRAALGDLIVEGGTTTVTNCADVTIARSNLEAVLGPDDAFVGRAGLNIIGSNVQLVSSEVRGGTGPQYSNPGGDGVVMSGGSNLWSMGSTIIGGDGDFGVPEFFIPGGNGGDAVVVGTGCTADIRGRTFADVLLAGSPGTATSASNPTAGVAVRTTGDGTARVASTMSGGLTTAGSGITNAGYSTPWLDYDPIAELGGVFSLRVYTEPGAITLVLPSLGAANVPIPEVTSTPLWIDPVTLGQPFPLIITTASNPETGSGPAYGVPNATQLIGGSFHLQAVVFDLVTNTFEGTNGGAVTIGL